MSKHYFEKSLLSAKTGAVKWLAVTALAFAGTTSVQAQADYSIFNSLSTQTTNLSFGTTSATVTAPAVTGILGGTSTAITTGALSNGWSAATSGALALTANAYTNRATVTTASGALTFGSVSSGILSGVLDVGVNMTYQASKVIAPSGSITTGGSNRFEYNFDLALNDGLLGLNVDLLGSLTVSAWSNGSMIASGSVFPDLLAITSITSSTYNDVKFIFDYVPSAGDLEIRWNGNALFNADLLGNLEGSGSTRDMYIVSDNSFGYLTPVPVPEPSSLLLCALGLGLILRRNGRPSVARA